MSHVTYFRLFIALILLAGGLTSGVLPQTTKPAADLSGFTQPASLASHVRALFEREDFAALDAVANAARTRKERFADGEWKLFHFYEALKLPAAGPRATDLEWEPHLLHMQNWHKRASQSITAHVAYGSALIEYALKARVAGQEWNDLTGEAGGKIFQARLKAGLKILSDVKKVKERCPHAYYVQLALAQAQGWSWTEFNIPYAQAIALEPTYHYYYQARAAHALPHNHGGQGEWENYANEVYQQLGKQEGALAYYMIVAHLRPLYGQKLFSQNRINWPRLKAGYDQLVTNYQGNNFRHNEMAFFATLARDAAAAKAAFERIGNNRDASVWQAQSSFDQKRAWAVSVNGALLRD
jgi:hypothetical protein